MGRRGNPAAVIPCDMVRRDIIVLAASAGGVDALRGIVRMLPTHFPAAILSFFILGLIVACCPRCFHKPGRSRRHTLPMVRSGDCAGAHLCGAARPSYAAYTRV